MTSLRQYSRDQGGRFSSVNSLVDRAQDEVKETYDKHPVATTVGATGAAVFGAKGASYARGAVALRNLTPDKAARLAHQLNQGQNHRITRDVFNPKDAFLAQSPIGQLADQGRAFRGAKKSIDPDLHGAAGQMKRAADLWADTHAGVRDSRRVASEKIGPIDFLNFNHRPKHRLMQRVVENSPTNQQELYRGMGMRNRPKVGDELDLDQTSWSDDRMLADHFAVAQSNINSSANRLAAKQRAANQAHGGGGQPVVLRMQQGKGRSTKISNLTRTKQGEHVTPKGKYRVVSEDNGYVYVERIEKAMHKSDPFGLTEMVTKNLSQAQIDRKKKIQSATSKTTGALGLGALSAQAAGSLISRGKLKKLPTLQGGKVGLRDAKPKKDAKKVLSARTPLLTASAGVGSLGAFNFASYTKAEAQQKKKAIPAQ